MMRPINAIIMRNLIKFTRNRMRLVMSLLMSGIFLFIFSFVTSSSVKMISNPINYLISGIIIMTVFQTSLNNSMNILEDISSGFMKEILVAPIARWQIAIGQVLSSTIIAVLQGIIIIFIGVFMGLQFDVIHGLLVIGMMIIVGFTFSSLGLYLASVSKDSTNFQLVVAIVTLPLTFLSGAYIPAMVLPKILLPFMYINPLTYTTATFRYLALSMENLSVEALVNAGVAFSVNGFVITPAMGAVFACIMGAVFFWMCVGRFSSADFSNVKVFKHGRH